MSRWLLAAVALAAAPALAQEEILGPPPPPQAIPADDLIAPPEVTAEEEAVAKVDPARRYRTPAEAESARAAIEDVVETARTEATPAIEPVASAPSSERAAVVRHARAWEANADHLSFLPDRQKALVGQLAYSAAAANLCDNVRLVPDRVAAAFAELKPAGALDANAGRLFERRLLVAYGVAVGLMMADHEANIPALCREAAEASGEGAQLYLAAAR